MKTEDDENKGVAFMLLDMDGATCTNCVRAVEHVGRKLKGVRDISVNRDNSQINLTYDPESTAVESVVNLVSKLGYTAVPHRE